MLRHRVTRRLHRNRRPSGAPVSGPIVLTGRNDVNAGVRFSDALSAQQLAFNTREPRARGIPFGEVEPRRVGARSARPLLARPRCRHHYGEPVTAARSAASSLDRAWHHDALIAQSAARISRSSWRRIAGDPGARGGRVLCANTTNSGVTRGEPRRARRPAARAPRTRASYRAVRHDVKIAASTHRSPIGEMLE